MQDGVPLNSPLTLSLAHKTRLARYMWVGGRGMSRTWEGTKHTAKRPDRPRLPLLHAGCVFVAEMPSKPGMHAATAGKARQARPELEEDTINSSECDCFGFTREWLSFERARDTERCTEGSYLPQCPAVSLSSGCRALRVAADSDQKWPSQRTTPHTTNLVSGTEMASRSRDLIAMSPSKGWTLSF
ncbi:hypothetical protein Q8A67_021694 [Cirrhinus molitorella]|uniref:Uncharacterized protein n=1 Tax=Cirrhinus molitorella TaxID=172907 RepID=A0AA88TEN6_9TELE|nr:hypothetical protein Q8A67_021694 [Cirrhinus molitorella]